MTRLVFSSCFKPFVSKYNSAIKLNSNNLELVNTKSLKIGSFKHYLDKDAYKKKLNNVTILEELKKRKISQYQDYMHFMRTNKDASLIHSENFQSLVCHIDLSKVSIDKRLLKMMDHPVVITYDLLENRMQIFPLTHYAGKKNSYVQYNGDPGKFTHDILTKSDMLLKDKTQMMRHSFMEFSLDKQAKDVTLVITQENVDYWHKIFPEIAYYQIV